MVPKQTAVGRLEQLGRPEVGYHCPFVYGDQRPPSPAAHAQEGVQQDPVCSLGFRSRLRSPGAQSFIIDFRVGSGPVRPAALLLNGLAHVARPFTSSGPGGVHGVGDAPPRR